MSMFTTLKVAALVLLGLFTALITSAIIAKEEAPREIPKPTITAREVRPGIAPRPRPRVGRIPKGTVLKAAFNFKAMKVAATGRTVNVVASVQITENRPGNSFVWMITTTDAVTGDPVVDYVYKTQRFSP